MEVQAGAITVRLEGGADGFEADLQVVHWEEGLELVHLRLTSPHAALPGVYRLSWAQPLVDIQAFWRPGTDRSRALPADWGDSFVSQASNFAPAGCLFNLNGENRHTFAFSDALNPVEIRAGVNEETAHFLFSLTLFTVPMKPLTEYEATLWLDTRPRPHYAILNEMQQWWATQPGYQPAPVPDLARLPMYSTWYSFHQRLNATGVEEQSRLAKMLGCEAVIVDDGWQTSNNDRGYAYCGDWQVFQEKIPDMRAHVAKIHELGLKFILWYALPFVGPKSRNFARFSGKFLGYLAHVDTWVLDPRFPDVREFMIGICEAALQEWDLDGFKLDFVQYFKQPSDEQLTEMQGRDYASVLEATDRLMSDLLARLRERKPEIMVEFRQPYIGPLMRKYGNMFRAGDCPNDSMSNRVRTLDVRLLCGKSAAHADMLMWHPAEPVESAALQVLSILFAVPQISVLLDQLPAEHHKMLTFWLAFWREHRELLLDGELKPYHPEFSYPVVEALHQAEQLIALYASTPVRPTAPLHPNFYIVNATLESGLILELEQTAGLYSLELRDCTGDLVGELQEISLEAGLRRLPVPPGGLASFRKIEKI